MACVDANYQFTMVDIGGYGRQGDAMTFSESEFGKKIINSTLSVPQDDFLPDSNELVPYVFVADEAFPLRPNLMRPFPGAQLHRDNPERSVFNYRLSRARRIVENAFGILSAKWRILFNTIDASPDNVDKIVKACVVLHNYMKSMDSVTSSSRKYVSTGLVDNEDENGIVIPGEWRLGVEFQSKRIRSSNYYSREANDVRDKFVKYFLTPYCSVSWQNERALSS